MDNIAFVLWVCLWPIVCVLEPYISTKRRLLLGEEKEESSKDREGFAVMIEIIIWVVIAVKLFVSPAGN